MKLLVDDSYIKQYQPRDDTFRRSVYYPGTVDQFRALMDRLEMLHPYEWVSADGRGLKFHETAQEGTSAASAVWTVRCSRPSGGASIAAFERPEGTLIEFFDGRTLGWGSWRAAEPLEAAFEEFAEVVVGEFPTQETEVAHQQASPQESDAQVMESRRRRLGPTVRTQERGKVFKRLKDKHPEWSQARVALEASEELGEVVTIETVRNTYRAMGWKWERGDRVR
jgi:hypothetical protein